MRSSKEHYADNAAKGRTVRFSLSINFNHVHEADRVGAIGTLKVSRGTLTPDQARRLMDIIAESEAS